MEDRRLDPRVARPWGPLVTAGVSGGQPWVCGDSTNRGTGETASDGQGVFFPGHTGEI